MDGKFIIKKRSYTWGTEECKEAIAFQVRKAMVAKRKFKVALAESGAKNRAIRSMGLQSAYTINELKKPFIVPRVNFDPSVLMNDPQAKKMLLENSMSSAKQLYGTTPKFYANGDDAIIETSFEETPQPTAEDINQMNENTPPVIQNNENGESSDPQPGAESKLTDNQRKAIFAQARKYWGDKADNKLHAGIKKQFNKDSVNDLTDAEAKKVIAGLNEVNHEINLTPDDLIRVAKLKWGLDQLAAVQNLNAIVNKRYKVASIDGLTHKQLNLVIGRIEDGKDNPILEPVGADDNDLPF